MEFLAKVKISRN